MRKKTTSERNFAAGGIGAPAFNCCIALGALIFKERLGAPEETLPDGARTPPPDDTPPDGSGTPTQGARGPGHYPANIHADKIYQPRSNRAWCKGMGIRLSGRPWGLPRELGKEEKRQQRQDERDRCLIEGKSGTLKRRGSLQRVMAKLAVTGCTVIGVAVLTLNLDQWLRFLCALLAGWSR